MKAAKKRGIVMDVTTGTVADFIGRSLDRALKLDRRQKLRAEVRLTFEDPTDLMRVLSAQRVRVIRALRIKPAAVSELATALNRDRKAVRRDVCVLESLGLVKTKEESNPGHGIRKVVEPLARRYRLMATL